MSYHLAGFGTEACGPDMGGACGGGGGGTPLSNDGFPYCKMTDKVQKVTPCYAPILEMKALFSEMKKTWPCPGDQFPWPAGQDPESKNVTCARVLMKDPAQPCPSGWTVGTGDKPNDACFQVPTLALPPPPDSTKAPPKSNKTIIIAAVVAAVFVAGVGIYAYSTRDK